jgi:hypothetical protein
MQANAASETAGFFTEVTGSNTTWARFRATPGEIGIVFNMPPGDGERFKTDTEAGRYRCALPECDGLLVVHAGPKNAHHWQHRTAIPVEHSPESLWHLAAKQRLAEFARAQKPKAEIHIDDRLTDSRNNKPDVWVRWEAGPGGPAGDVAFEAQRSALDPRGLGRRNATYGLDGIVPVWLFAHLLAPDLVEGAIVSLHREHQAASETPAVAVVQPGPRFDRYRLRREGRSSRRALW